MIVPAVLGVVALAALILPSTKKAASPELPPPMPIPPPTPPSPTPQPGPHTGPDPDVVRTYMAKLRFMGYNAPDSGNASDLHVRAQVEYFQMDHPGRVRQDGVLDQATMNLIDQEYAAEVEKKKLAPLPPDYRPDSPPSDILPGQEQRLRERPLYF